MSTRSSMLPLAGVFSMLLIAAALVFTGCDAPSSESEATTVSSSSAIQASAGPTFASVGLGAGVIASRINFRSHPRRDVRIVTAQISVFPNGGFVPWHTHPALGVVGVVTGGGTLTLVTEECSKRTYPTGTAFQPPHNIHTARNLTSQPVEIFATFLIEEREGAFLPPTTLEPAEVQEELNEKCGF